MATIIGGLRATYWYGLRGWGQEIEFRQKFRWLRSVGRIRRFSWSLPVGDRCYRQHEFSDFA